MTDAIQIQGVSKTFGRNQVLNNVSLMIPQGVVFALLGENGAGKSTLIRGLMGYHRFDSGQVSVAGFDPIRQPLELRRNVGYVSDAPGLYEWMSVAECGWYASGFFEQGYLTAFNNFIVEFDLPPDTRISDLSKGMRAKVALSLALASDPQLLILDEPTSGLDPLVRRSFLESMIDRAAAGQTVFLSSHQMHEVERVADWIAILHDGQVQVVAPLEDLKRDVVIISFSLRDPLLAMPAALDDQNVLRRATHGRTTQLMVRGPSDDLLRQLSQEPNLFEIQSVRPSLEELYIGFSQSGLVETSTVLPTSTEQSEVA